MGRNNRCFQLVNYNIIERGKYHELVRIAESFHEKDCQIADAITEEHEKKDYFNFWPVIIRKDYLGSKINNSTQNKRIKPVSISTDDYFVDRKHLG